MQWFTHESISKSTIRIKDNANVFSYLVTGNKFSCLLDTGSGFGNIKEYVQQLTDKPIIVILTHGHVDHIGGAGLFDEVYMNHKDLKVLQRDSAVEYRYQFYRTDKNLCTLPKEAYNPPIKLCKVKHLEDQQVFDLGGISLKAISVPGHTPGMTCILIVEERTILFGDACGEFTLLFDEYASFVEEYQEGLSKLKKIETLYDKVIRNHGTGISSKIILDNVIDCVKRVLSREDDKVLFSFQNVELYISTNINSQTFMRMDGKEGNLVYRKDKIYKL